MFPAERSRVISGQPDFRHKAKPSFVFIVIFVDVTFEADISCTSEAEVCLIGFEAIAWYADCVDIELKGHFYLKQTGCAEGKGEAEWESASPYCSSEY